MPSPFPGMDPYLEMEDWGDFHHAVMWEIKQQLVPQITPKYLAIVDRRVYLEHHDEEVDQFLPDINVIRAQSRPQHIGSAVATATDTVHETETYFVLLPHEHREHFLLIRDRDSNEVITVIEMLSPANKTKSADGFRIYNEKRETILLSGTNLVEIDLLRAGVRPSTTRPLRETTDYCVMIHRAKKRPAIDVLQWTLRQPMPVVSIPLANGDPDAQVDMQAGFRRIYESSAYQLLLKYDRPLRPKARAEDEAWLQSVLSNANSSRHQT